MCLEKFPKLTKFTIDNKNHGRGDINGWEVVTKACLWPSLDLIWFIDEGLASQENWKPDELGTSCRLEFVWHADEGEVLEFNSQTYAVNTMGTALSEFWKGVELVEEEESKENIDDM